MNKSKPASDLRGFLHLQFSPGVELLVVFGKAPMMASTGLFSPSMTELATQICGLSFGRAKASTLKFGTPMERPMKWTLHNFYVELGV
jgi:hypothetical protein